MTEGLKNIQFSCHEVVVLFFQYKHHCRRKMELLMVLLSRRFYLVGRLLVFCMAFQRFTKPDALTAPLFPLSTPTITIWLLFLVSILQPIFTNSHTVKDSFSFADWAKTYKHNNEIMCSFDVSSLFTNVPLDETIHICLDKLYSRPDPPKFSPSCFTEFVEVRH